MAQFAYYESPFGILKIGYREGFVTHISLTDVMDTENTPSPLSELAAGQLIQYFEGTRKSFDFPIRTEGTPFRKAVWETLRQIPYGEIRTYGQIAAAIGNPHAARAVGQACNQNPVWIAIPCHRVLGVKNGLTGYAGGTELKKKLLELEKHHR